jgi:hypothetical protein
MGSRKRAVICGGRRPKGRAAMLGRDARRHSAIKTDKSPQELARLYYRKLG